jgi:hypothetical protein
MQWASGAENGIWRLWRRIRQTIVLRLSPVSHLRSVKSAPFEMPYIAWNNDLLYVFFCELWVITPWNISVISLIQISTRYGSSVQKLELPGKSAACLITLKMLR